MSFINNYTKALETDPNSNIAKFNLANTWYKQKKQDEAVKVFTEVAGNAGKIDLKAKAFYNKGAVLSQQEKLEESIEAYKNTLRIDPDDKEARENLQKALLDLKKKKQPEKKKEQEKKQKQQEQPQSKMSPKEAQQRLQLLAQKEKEVQQRIQKDKVKPGGNQAKDW
jgi:tetratricopeptide (TPR) repeat protein